LAYFSGIKSNRKGFRVQQLAERLAEELERPHLAVNSFEDILRKIETASGGALTERIQNITRGSLFSSSMNASKTPSTGGFWTRDHLPMREFKK
jgi:hypothetical protein